MTVANRYTTGNLVRTWIEFRNEAGDLQDPTTVTLTLRDPLDEDTIISGTVADPDQLTRTEEGKWEYRFEPDLEGDYRYRWEGAGQLVAVAEGMLVAETGLN
jgi:hypothetical protein